MQLWQAGGPYPLKDENALYVVYPEVEPHSCWCDLCVSATKSFTNYRVIISTVFREGLQQRFILHRAWVLRFGERKGCRNHLLNSRRHGNVEVSRQCRTLL